MLRPTVPLAWQPVFKGDIGRIVGSCRCCCRRSVAPAGLHHAGPAEIATVYHLFLKSWLACRR
jgi:hypothetical protein